MIEIKTDEGLLAYSDVENLGESRTTIKNYFHNHRGIIIHVPETWGREKKGGWGGYLVYKNLRKGDEFVVSVTKRVDDRLASGMQSTSETFGFKIVEILPGKIKITEQGKNRRTKGYYPAFF